ncbi:hypothetical protein EDB81DRAFT_457065 [Dactylonectria macrodidyma]|uniref:Uncharacterized protein n=1 Tax=Dactylonectria macrodidyma TaxID=307937 RepID=A0A9P9F4Q6_9HYPO|nr:hypothetical protein EDB81DRAFT_457065 [Dactylonectria macrodidyma]
MTVIMLKEQVRAAGDPELQRLLRRVREGQQSKVDLNYPNGTCFHDGRCILWQSDVTASLAARSAASLPYGPLWAGIHRISTVKPCVRSSCIHCVMSWRRYDPDLPLGLTTDLIAAWLSV